MYSLWTEASRDVEEENTLRRLALADSEINQHLFPFMALSRSEEEYGHRKALASERIKAVAEKTGASVEEVTTQLDKKMSYLLEAMQVTAEERESYVVVDANDTKLGGPYSSKEAADQAIEAAFSDRPGVKVVPEGSYNNERGMVSAASRNDDGPIHLKDKYVSALAGLRQALHEGEDPLAGIPDLERGSESEQAEAGGESGRTSEHNEDSDPKAHLPGGSIPDTTAAGENPNSPTPQQAGAGDTFTGGNAPSSVQDASVSMPNTNPTPDAAQNANANTTTNTPYPPSPSSPGTPISASLQGKIAAMKREISRHNPNLSEERVEKIAHKVASNYLSREQ